jgi:hypothetical protein
VHPVQKGLNAVQAVSNPGDILVGSFADHPGSTQFSLFVL